MLYLIKSIYIWLLPPGIFIIALLLLAVYLLRVKRGAAIVTALLAAVFYICSTEYFGGMCIRSLESRYYPPASIKADVVILLGGGAVSDIDNVGVKGHLSSGAGARTLTAARIAKLYALPVLYTGGNTYDYGANESEIVKQILQDVGVAEQNILLETKSLNTAQNVRNIRSMLSEYNYKQPLVVTSAYHMPRSMMIFRQNGIVVTAYPTHYQTDHRNVASVNLFSPTSNGLEMTATAVREYLGMLALGFGYGKL